MASRGELLQPSACPGGPALTRAIGGWTGPPVRAIGRGWPRTVTRGWRGPPPEGFGPQGGAWDGRARRSVVGERMTQSISSYLGESIELLERMKALSLEPRLEAAIARIAARSRSGSSACSACPVTSGSVGCSTAPG